MIDPRSVSKGIVDMPVRVLLYGADGVGKSSFCAGAPDPLFVDPASGSLSYDVRRVVPKDWAETRQWVGAVADGSVPCKTLVLDSLSELETMSHEHLFPGSSIDQFDKGYGRGDTVALVEWRDFLAQLDRVWNRGIGIVVVAHATVTKFEDPSGPAYDRYQVSARKSMSLLLRQWVSYVLFAREEVFLQASEKGGVKKATTTGARFVYTRRTPAWDAKARGTAEFADRLPLGWASFAAAIREDRARVDGATKQIRRLLEELSDPALSDQVGAFLRAHPAQALGALERLKALRAERAKAQKSEPPSVALSESVVLQKPPETSSLSETVVTPITNEGAT